jgi:hypothetical protein
MNPHKNKTSVNYTRSHLVFIKINNQNFNDSWDTDHESGKM